MTGKKVILYLTIITLGIITGCGGTGSNGGSPSKPPNDGNGKKYKNSVTQNLIVVTYDGVRWQEIFEGADPDLIHNPAYIHGSYSQTLNKYWADSKKKRRKKLSPFFWSVISKEGKLYGNRKFDNDVNVTNAAVKSTPGYSSIWTGYNDPSITTNHPGINPNTNVLEFLQKESGFGDKNIQVYAAAGNFTKILAVKRNNLLVSAGHKDQTVYNKTMRALKNDHPRVLYMQVNNSDHVAHEGQYDTYLNYIHKYDSWVQNIWDYVQQDEFYKDKTTLLITVDHGRGLGSQWITHGTTKSSGVLNANFIWFAIIGPDTKPTGEQKDKNLVKQTQFAKTMAALLGFHFDPSDHPVGNVINSVFDNDK